MQREGKIEIVIGTMFGGKSTELLRRLERALRARQDVIVFSKDSRYVKGYVTTHTEMVMKGHFVNDSGELDAILEQNPDVDVVGIDEIQFFDLDIVAVCNKWALRGKRIICAGLDQDYDARPFETTIAMVAQAEEVQKVLAICTKCGKDAVRNHLKVRAESRIMEGASDLYEALCRRCYHEIRSGT